LAGIYIHIPFCRQKCHYCNFFSIASVKNREKFLDALIAEIKLQKDYLKGEEVETIYFGGGTPSLLSAAEINRIFNEIQKIHIVSSSPEITLETNPDDLTGMWINDLNKTPFNRLSIGVQSFSDADLKYLNRVHTGKQALKAIKNVLNAGYENLGIDLIYGIPTLTQKGWLRNLELFLSLQIPHLSAYALTVEPKTALDVLIKKKKLSPVSDDKTADHFQIVMDRMEMAGYTHYEISNFCKDDNYSRHNRNYWTGVKYLGIGPSAHSYDGDSRQWNPSGLNQYLSILEKSELRPQIEYLTAEQKYNEYILTAIRTVWGIEKDSISKKFGNRILSHFLARVKKYIENECVIWEQGAFKLSRNGKLFADGIAADLFI